MTIKLTTELTHANTGQLELVYHFDNVEEGLYLHDACTAQNIRVFPRRMTIENEFTQFIRVLIANDTERLLLKLSV